MGAWLGWTEARIIELRRLREVLGLSLGQVVKVWAGPDGGPSRNAIIGACYRNGIGGAPHVPLKSGKPRTRKPWRPEGTPEPSSQEPKLREGALPELRTVEVQCTPKLLTDLERSECRFPVSGEGEETLFCAAPRHRHRCYCAAHRAIAYQPTPTLTEEDIIRAIRTFTGERWAA